MSATIQEHTFASYFDDARTARIPGRTHPVQDYYLEDLVQHFPYSGSRMPGGSKLSEDQLSAMRNAFASSGVSSSRHLDILCGSARSDRFDFALIGAAVSLILQRAGNLPGAILVFVSGVAEIGQAIDSIRNATQQQLDILPLHANLPPREQALVFRPTRNRKVVVATNVAETSITIDDVVYVIDSGRVKETAFDAFTGISRLVEGNVSRASANQRRGRAGRTQPGECWRLYDKSWTEPKMAAQSVRARARLRPCGLMTCTGSRDIADASGTYRPADQGKPPDSGARCLSRQGALAAKATSHRERLAGAALTGSD
jgi:HrpA-like RNA helicase